MEETRTENEAEALRGENKRLQERLEMLEGEMIEQAARTNRVVAELEARAYWLDRWHVDLNALMEKPGATQFRALLRAIRAPYRLLVNFSRNRRTR